jgi:predicted MFS family arabinose efflux permease
MGGLALLLLMVDITDSYFLAGLVDATWTLVGAFTAPAIAILIDKYGQRRVIGPQITIHVIAVAAILVLAAADAPYWTFFIAAAVAGACLPVMGAAVRARWSYLLGDSALLRTAYSWESVVDEFVFIVGPPLAASVSAYLGPPQAVALTAVIGATGTIGFLVQRKTEPPANPDRRHTGRLAIAYRGMPLLQVVMVMLGVVFAGVEVTVIATAREGGDTAAAGIVLAVWSVSSMIAGLVIGGLRRLPGLHVQLVLSCGFLAASLVPLLFVESLPAIAIVLLVGGAAVSPALIAGFALAARLVPAGSLTESLTWTSTSIAIGFALGSPSSGWLVDQVALTSGFWVAMTAAFVACLAATAGKRAMAREYVGGGDTTDAEQSV